MYFSEFYHGPIKKKRYFLSGANSFLINLSIEKISRFYNRPVKQVSNDSQLAEFYTKPLFSIPAIPVITKELKTYPEYAIVISKKKMIAKYKKEGFEEILCGDLFPNQVEMLVGKTLPAGIDTRLVKFICFQNDYDLLSIFNTIKLLQVSGLSISSMPIEQLIQFCGNISDPESTKVINYLIEKNYVAFIRLLYSTHDLRGLSFLLLAQVSNALTYLENKSQTWYAKRMNIFANFIFNGPPHKILYYLNNIAYDFSLTNSQLRFKLIRLIAYLTNQTKILEDV